MTIEAIKESIRLWEIKREASDPSEIKLGADNCPLCKLYRTFDDDCVQSCAGCPVYLKTGEIGCKGTPYSEAAGKKTAWMMTPMTICGIEFYAAKDKWQEAAQAEIDFLKSLLPNEPDEERLG